MVAQVVIRLTLYIDQAIIRSKTTKTQGIDNTVSVNRLLLKNIYLLISLLLKISIGFQQKSFIPPSK